MPVDFKIIGEKIRRHREQLEFSYNEVSGKTGIAEQRLISIEAGELEPTGDEILIIADLFKCDFRILVLNESENALDTTDILYRRHGSELSAEDRRSIQEFIFLCECESELELLLERPKPLQFTPVYSGTFMKGHAKPVAAQLRRTLGYNDQKVTLDVYSDFRRLGVHLFRRRLVNSDISGLFLVHPKAGKCILVNYSEDIYRQRFSATHEMAHAIFDSDETASISFWRNSTDLREVRANNFASNFLMPPEFIAQFARLGHWDETKHRFWAEKLKVNGFSLAIALMQENVITDQDFSILKKITIPTDTKSDPELPASLSDLSLQRAIELLSHGLSKYYVNLCFDAHGNRLVSAGRLAEMLLIAPAELDEVAKLFGRELNYGD